MQKYSVVMNFNEQRSTITSEDGFSQIYEDVMDWHDRTYACMMRLCMVFGAEFELETVGLETAKDYVSKFRVEYESIESYDKEDEGIIQKE